MADVTTILLEILLAVTFFGLFSAAYKRTWFYGLLSNMLLAVSLGYMVVSQITAVQNTLLARISGGESIYIIALVIGLLYFTAAISKLKVLYRAVTVVTLSIGLGLTLNLSMVKVWDWVINFAGNAFTGLAPFLAMFFLATGISNFLFSRHLDKGPMNLSRQIGRVGLLSYSAYFIGTYLSGTVARMLFFILQINKGNAWWVPYVIFAGILVDATGILKRKTPKIEAES
jgi:hypothetical protein